MKRFFSGYFIIYVLVVFALHNHLFFIVHAHESEQNIYILEKHKTSDEHNDKDQVHKHHDSDLHSHNLNDTYCRIIRITKHICSDFSKVINSDVVYLQNINCYILSKPFFSNKTINSPDTFRNLPLLI